jgi:uncharacterized protein (DUF3820 family)
MIKLPFGDLKLKFGIHRGKQLQDIPDNYLLFLVNKGILKGKALFHCQVRFNLPKQTFIVTVSDAVTGNGAYSVQAYNSTHAINECRRLHSIQNTQSYHGTEYSVSSK